MRLVVLFGIIDGLDRDLVYLEPSGALQEHLCLIFESFALAVYKIRHEIERDSSKARLRITYLDSGYIREDLDRDVIADTALPGDILAVELPDAQDERIRICYERTHYRSYACRRMLSVGVGGNTSDHIGHIVSDVFECGLQCPALTPVGTVRDVFSAVGFDDSGSLGKDLIILGAAAVVDDNDRRHVFLYDIVQQRNKPFIRLVRRYDYRYFLGQIIHMKTY